MNQQPPAQNIEVEETTFAALTTLVKAELQSDPTTDCLALAKTYGISKTTMRKLIDTVRLESN